MRQYDTGRAKPSENGNGHQGRQSALSDKCPNTISTDTRQSVRLKLL